MIEITPDLVAANRLDEYDIDRRRLYDYDLPGVQAVTTDNSATRFVAFGNVLSTPNVMSVVAPYSTLVDAPHYLVRLKAMQVALGDEFSLIAIEANNPNKQKFTKEQRKKVSQGNFDPLSERVLSVLEHKQFESDQKIFLYGHSMGADVSTELAFQNQFNPSRGILNIAGLCINEAARTTKRTPREVLGAFKKSGTGLLQNVIDTNSPALLDAWKLPLFSFNVEDFRYRFEVRVGLGVGKYAIADVLGNLALVRGFATDRTIEQIERLNTEHLRVKNSRINRAINNTFPITAIKSTNSNVFDQSGFDRIQLESMRKGSEITTREVNGDHSNDDNIRIAASTVLAFAMS